MNGDWDADPVNDRRRHPRDDVAFPVRVLLDPEDPHGPALEGNMYDLNRHGARIVTQKHWFSSSQDCVVEFADAGAEARTVRVAGQVRWAMQDEPDVSILGIEFEPPLDSVTPHQPPRKR
jgi:hypothetical protein